MIVLHRVELVKKKKEGEEADALKYLEDQFLLQRRQFRLLWRILLLLRDLLPQLFALLLDRVRLPNQRLLHHHEY